MDTEAERGERTMAEAARKGGRRKGELGVRALVANPIAARRVFV